MNKKQQRKENAIEIVRKYLEQNPIKKITELVPATNPPSLGNVNLSNKQVAQLPFHPIVVSAMCGTIFGDSSIAIHKGFKNARLQNRHSTIQTEWFMWKRFYLFGEFTSDNSVSWHEPDGSQPESGPQIVEDPLYGKLRLSTLVSPKLTALYNILCPKGHKEISRFWLNHMNNYFFMALWLDDGSLVGQRQGVICCNNTPKAQAQILVDYMRTVWGIGCKVVDCPSRVTKTLSNPVAITIDDLDSLEILLRIIAPIVPVKSMLYKVCLFPMESSRLQRWTSELKTLVRKDWHYEIEKLYAEF